MCFNIFLTSTNIKKQTYHLMSNVAKMSMVELFHIHSLPHIFINKYLYYKIINPLTRFDIQTQSYIDDKEHI